MAVDNSLPPDPTAGLSRRKKRRARRVIAHAEGRCLATAKRSRKRCQLEPEPGRPTCKLHGGAGGRPSSHGRYSDMPARIQAAYEAGLHDPSLFDLAPNVALLDALVNEQGRRVEDGDSPHLRRTARTLLDRYMEALAAGEVAAAQGALQELADLLSRADEQARAEKELFDRAERSARRKEEGWRLKLDRKLVVNGGDLAEILYRFIGVLRTRLPESLARACVDDLEAIVRGDGPDGGLIPKAERIVNAEVRR